MSRNTPNLNLFVPDPGQSGIAAQLNSNYDAIDGTMDPVGGHKHTGAAGQAPKIAVANIAATGTPDATTYLRGDGQWAVASSGTSGVTDHGALTGLTDDDHPQYATQARGDARYLQLANNLSDLTNAAAARTALDAAQTAHVHAAADVTSGVMAQARLGAGAASSSTYLRGDGQWSAIGFTTQPAGIEKLFGWYDETVPTAATLGPSYPITADLTLVRSEGWAEIVATGSAVSFDIQYKRGAGAWTSIFSTLPQFAVGANQRTTGTLSTTQLNAGDFVRRRWIGTPAGIADVSVYLVGVTR
jgi:hypothetical protein